MGTAKAGALREPERCGELCEASTRRRVEMRSLFVQEVTEVVTPSSPRMEKTDACHNGFFVREITVYHTTLSVLLHLNVLLL